MKKRTLLIFTVVLIITNILTLSKRSAYCCQTEQTTKTATNSTPSSTKGPFRLKGSTHYALIINGDHSNLHKANVRLFHKTLLSQGYNNHDIYILNTEQVENSSAYNNRATLDTVKKTFNYLKKQLTPKDTLTIYITGHGHRDQKRSQSTIVLENSAYLSQKDFRKLTDELQFKQLVLISDICYSGGIINELTKNNTKNIIGISASDSTHTTYCRYFIRAFCHSFHNSNADLNKDGLISLAEAFSYATKIHKKMLIDRIDETNAQFKFCGAKKDLILQRTPKK